jgi:hypothetical protein
MIVVRVELHSAVTGAVTEIARMDICNEGGSARRGDYGAYAMRGRDRKTLECRNVQREAKVFGYPRLDIHVWHLVAACLRKLNYRWEEKT